MVHGGSSVSVFDERREGSVSGSARNTAVGNLCIETVFLSR